MMVLQVVLILGTDGSVVVERLLNVFSFRFFFLLFSLILGHFVLILTVA